jgi:hypothetical protein
VAVNESPHARLGEGNIVESITEAPKRPPRLSTSCADAGAVKRAVERMTAQQAGVLITPAVASRDGL